MALTLSETAILKAQQINIQPQIVLEIDGVATKFGMGVILKYVRIGDPDLYIGDDWKIGGYNAISSQADLISLDSGTTTTIQQQLNPDTSIGSSVSSLAIALVDDNQVVSRLISPGLVVTDILARKARVYLGFAGTAYKEDFILVHQGIIDDIQSKAGMIVINIAHPDASKRQQIFKRIDSTLDENINDSETTITLTTTDGFLQERGPTTPQGFSDGVFASYVRIDDEIIQYSGVSGFNLTACFRGALGTTAAAHAITTPVTTFYRLTEDCMTLALKIMLSGWDTYYKTGVDVTHFGYITPTEVVDNSIFFYTVNLDEEYGLTVGDYITTTGASNGANNVTLKAISDLVVTDDGTYIVIDGVTFVNEIDSAATISFRSKYDTLPDGLKMDPSQVDVAQHETLFRLYLSSFEYDFYLKDTITGKDFLEQEVYKPASVYALPRKTRASAQYHIGPIPSFEIKTLDDTNIGVPDKIVLRRSLSKNFYNTIIYKFDEMVLEERFLSGRVVTNATSRTQIPIGTKALAVTSKGLRADLQGRTLSGVASNRRLNRYAFAAEFFDGLEVLYGDGFNVEIGDIVIFDSGQLNVTNTEDGTRFNEPKLFEVVNKSIDIKTGKVKLNLTDTNFNNANRYCLIGPASYIKTPYSVTSWQIERSFASVYGINEFRKWRRYTNPGVKVHNHDSGWSRNDQSFILTANSNTITIDPGIGFTPVAGDIMELADYNFNTEQIHLVYGFMRDSTTFDDGKAYYRML